MRAALLAVAVSFPVHAADLAVLVVTGSADRDAAAKQLEAVKKKAADLDGVLKLPPGFPKLEESAAVTGLKPGFFIVVAGYCADDKLLPAVKALDPGAYAKMVQVDAAACPSLADRIEVKTAEAKDAEKRVLRATLFATTDERDSWLLHLSWRDKSGALLAERLVAEIDAAGCMYGGTAEVSAKAGAILVKTVDCMKSRGCPNPGPATVAMTFTAAADTIADEVKVLKDPGYKGCKGE
jgi:hypothetical protein